LRPVWRLLTSNTLHLRGDKNHGYTAIGYHV
jgi:hypothetical protein